MSEKNVRLETITYQYNGVGLVSDMAVSGESSFTYSYNAANQLSSVTNPNSVQVSFTYDNGGRCTRITDPGSYVEYVYNARNWLTDVRNRTTGGTTRYDATYYYQDGNLWDHTGNPVKRVENLAGSTYTTTLRYDAVYRQTEETKRDSGNNVVYSLTYGYDAVGNRTTKTLGGTTITYTYDDNNKLTSANDGSSFGYDSNGNMTSVSGPLGSRTMVYDDENNLTSVICGGVTDLYYYNSEGQRYRARLNGTYYRYLYDGDRVLEELNDSGTMQARYTTEDDSYDGSLLHLYRTSGTLSRFPMYDNIGSVRGLVDAGGSVTDTYELDTFGRSVSSTGTTPNPYRFGGEWGYIADPSGMLQLGVRNYWPELGIFLQQDPSGGENNWYSYAEDDPVTQYDPDGERTRHGRHHGHGHGHGHHRGHGHGHRHSKPQPKPPAPPKPKPPAPPKPCPSPQPCPKTPGDRCKKDHPSPSDCKKCVEATDHESCCRRGKAHGWSESAYNRCEGDAARQYGIMKSLENLGGLMEDPPECRR